MWVWRAWTVQPFDQTDSIYGRGACTYRVLDEGIGNRLQGVGNEKGVEGFAKRKSKEDQNVFSHLATGRPNNSRRTRLEHSNLRKMKHAVDFAHWRSCDCRNKQTSNAPSAEKFCHVYAYKYHNTRTRSKGCGKAHD